MSGAIPPLPQYTSWRGAQLKHRDNFTFTFYLGRGIVPTEGLYLHGITQHGNANTHIHASSGIRTHDPSVRAAEDRAGIGTG
jgi:hypothetical protein